MKTSHTITILKKFLSGAALSSNDIFASNSNQYFCGLKDHGIELDEELVPNTDNGYKHKERSLAMDEDNIAKAVSLLRRLQG